jgi:hypothetical protein
MSPFRPCKTELSRTTKIPAPPEQIFPLLCPVRETDWICDWKCDMVYTSSGFNELHCIFQTHWEQVGQETWFTVDYTPNRSVAFVRASGDWIIHYVISLTPTNIGTEVNWQQVLVGMTPGGNDNIARMTRKFNDMIDQLGKALAYYLTYNKCLMEKTC